MCRPIHSHSFTIQVSQIWHLFFPISFSGFLVLFSPLCRFILNPFMPPPSTTKTLTYVGHELLPFVDILLIGLPALARTRQHERKRTTNDNDISAGKWISSWNRWQRKHQPYHKADNYPYNTIPSNSTEGRWNVEGSEKKCNEFEVSLKL